MAFLSQKQLLPKVGTYLGTKKYCTLEQVSFSPERSQDCWPAGNLTGENVKFFGLDAFMTYLVKGAALTAYALYQNDYGKNYTLGLLTKLANATRVVGYVIPSKSKHVFSLMCLRRKKNWRFKWQRFAIGLCKCFSGHNSKLTLEYQSLKYASNKAVNTITLQAMIYL
jgi:hypothetical protein